MIYLAGDNNLSTAGDTDVEEMRQVGSSRDANVVVQFDNAGDAGTRRFHLQRDGENEEVEDLGETDSGDPSVLSDFISWTAQNYPAERYALVLWNHGSGWTPTEVDKIARSVEARNYNAREAVERSATPMARSLFRTTIEEIFSLPSPAERAICSDDGSGHSLDTIELGKVLAGAVEKLGQRIDLLGMDACLMSNLEVAYQARPYVRYIAASEELEPNDGWPYDVVLRQIVDNPDLPTGELAAHIVKSYVKSYVKRDYPDPVTQAALDVDKVDDVIGPMDELADALIAGMPDVAYQVWQAQRKSASFFYNTLWDISHLCEELDKEQSSDAVRQASKKVREALKVGEGNFVVAEAHNGSSVERCGGVTIYLQPPILNEVSRYYADLDYSKEHRWLDLLKAYHAA
jgi:Clostripain family